METFAVNDEKREADVEAFTAIKWRNITGRFLPQQSRRRLDSLATLKWYINFNLALE